MNIKKKIAVIGCTGSIGTTSLSIIKKYQNFFKVELLACNQSYKKLLSQIKIFSPKYVFINNPAARKKFKKNKLNKKIKLIENIQSISQFYNKDNKFDKVILGVPSIEGLNYAFDLINFSKEILIANKESIICGAHLLMNKARNLKCKITSIDSELYCLSQLISKHDFKNIDKVYLTASGGPFLNKKKKFYAKSSLKKVINHPNWKMGKKISIDSATMVNKVFEMIETHVIFNLPFKKIKIKIHKQSFVHACVVYYNGLVKLGMHDISMEIPIRNSLFDNCYFLQNSNIFKNKKNINFDFNETNLSQFKVINLGIKISKLGHCAWILFNVINDILVNKFINNKVDFYEIEKKLLNVFERSSVLLYCKKTSIKSLNDIKKVIEFGNSIPLNI